MHVITNIGNPRKQGARVYRFRLEVRRNCYRKGLTIGQGGFLFVTRYLVLSLYRWL